MYNWSWNEVPVLQKSNWQWHIHIQRKHIDTYIMYVNTYNKGLFFTGAVTAGTGKKLHYYVMENYSRARTAMASTLSVYLALGTRRTRQWEIRQSPLWFPSCVCPYTNKHLYLLSCLGQAHDRFHCFWIRDFNGEGGGGLGVSTV